MPAPDLHVLETGRLRLELCPELGASVVNFDARIKGKRQPVLRHTSPEALAKALSSHSASPLASFTLAPFSNRLPGAAFRFGGREYRLRPTSPDGTTQHGDVRSRPHETLAVSRTRAEYSFDSRGVPDLNYPFAFSLRTTYALADHTLTQTLELTNTDKVRAPFGFGLHPYFNRHFAGVRDVDLAFDAGGFYPTDGSFIPTGPMQPIPADLDFTRAWPVGAQELNTGYGDFGGTATLTYQDAPERLTLRASPVFSHLVVFTAPDGSLALEPVSHATNALNLHEAGVPGTGFTALEPGEVLRGSVTFELLG